MPEERRLSYLIDGKEFTARPLSAGLHVVSTPIGNLGDVTLRALATLAAADVIACEDTRVTSKLTRHYGIGAKLTPYHDHNEARQGPTLLQDIAEGRSVALVSDAGTPLLSDPGLRLVRLIVEAGHPVFVVPGPSALTAGLAGAGLPTETVLYAGFLPPKQAARRRRLAELAAIPATLVFYEAPHRIADSLADMTTELGGEREAVVARELTKLYETFYRAPLASLAADFAAMTEVKGEIVVLVAPPGEKVLAGADIDARLRMLLETQPIAAAAAALALESGLPRRDLYARALVIKAERDDG